MIKRIVDISNPSRLSLRNRQLVIEQNGEEAGSVPLEDLGVLILDNPIISHTQGLLAACCENNVAVLLCDKKHLPASVILPLSGHTLHSRTIRQQVQTTEPTRKRMWKEIVQAKISAQALNLKIIHGDDRPIKAFADRVKSGDPDNLEAQAARIYWRELFGESFRRERDRPGENAMLNYGYAIIRAAVARAVVGTGLHPALGLHHHNQYDSLCLADDLMEPLRPLVDWKVYQIRSTLNKKGDITPEIKALILSLLDTPCKIRKKPFPLIPALHHYTASIRKIICKEGKTISFPKPIFEKASN